MTDWRTLADAGRWDDFDALLDVPMGDLPELVERAKAVVPLVEVRDGAETHLRPALCHEIEGGGDEARHLRAAALALTEAEGAIADLRSKVLWADMRSEALDRLGPLTNPLDDEIEHQGSAELSRSEQAQRAEYLLKTLDAEGYADRYGEPNDRDWLVELVSDVALTAFEAGIKARAAAGKGVEYDYRKRTFTGPSEGGRGRADNRRDQDEADMRRMEELIAADSTPHGAITRAAHKVSREIDADIAAELVDRRPRSAEALRRSYSNWRKQKR